MISAPEWISSDVKYPIPQPSSRTTMPGLRWLLSILTRRAQRNFPAGLSQFQTSPAPCSARRRPCAISLSSRFKESSLGLMFRWASSRMEGLPPEKHHASRCKEQHAQKDHSMAPALDVRCPVLSLAIADGNFDDFQAHPRRAKKEIKIAEWVDISKKIPRGGEALIVRSGDDFCAA